VTALEGVGCCQAMREHEVGTALRDVGARVADTGVAPVDYGGEAASEPDRVARPVVVVHQAGLDRGDGVDVLLQRCMCLALQWRGDAIAIVVQLLTSRPQTTKPRHVEALWRDAVHLNQRARQAVDPRALVA